MIFSMSNVNIIFDTKLQPNNSLHTSKLNKIDLLVTKEQIKRISPFHFGTCRSLEQKAQVSLCICVGRRARAFAARIHKVGWRLMTKF